MIAGGIAVKSIPVGVNFFIPLCDMEKYLAVDSNPPSTATRKPFTTERP